MIDHIWRYIIARMLIRNGYDPLDVKRYYGRVIYDFVFKIPKETDG